MSGAGCVNRLLVRSQSHWPSLLFVFLWSTGFIGSKYGVAYAEPLTLLTIRSAIAALLLAILVPLLKEPWPRSWQQFFSAALVGVLLHGVYLGGVFSAIDRGIDAGFSALVVGLQPLLTVLLAAVWLKEALTAVKLLGIFLGLTGVILVLLDRGVAFEGVQAMDAVGLVFCIAALVGITVGTLYQKRFCSDVPLVSGAAVQYASVVVVLYPISLMFETQQIDWTPTLVGALAWLVLVLSIGAVLLLMQLLRRGEAGQVASLFYLVPPIVAVEAWLLFDERLSTLGIMGFALCVAGVALVAASSGSNRS